jgi:RNA-directed DNA polymerase
LAKARQRCWKYQWVVDLDIKGFFENLDHDLLLRAVKKHVTTKWTLFYVERWLKAAVMQSDGSLVSREKGTPQGGVVSPLLANLFLHYAFDKWIRKYHPNVQFGRYADDIVIHCQSKQQAEFIKHAVELRLATCKLGSNQQKTKVVYCGLSKDIENYPHRSFDFLGYSFRRRVAQSKEGKHFVGFLPAVSNEAKRNINRTIKRWRLHRRTAETIEKLAKQINPVIRGWVNYYGRFYRSGLERPLMQVEVYLKRWVRSKFRKRTGLLGMNTAWRYLGRVRKYKPHLFEHWRYECGTRIV